AARPPSSSTTAPPPNPTLFPYTTLFRSEISAHNASVRLMDFEKGIQLPEKVDTIIMSLVLHHIPNYQALLASLLEQLNEEVQAAGFGNVEADMFFENQESSRFLLRATK